MRLRLLLLCLLPVLPGAARTFHETGGATHEGDITSASGTSVTIRHLDGSRTELPLERLRKADRDFVARWLAEPLPELKVVPRFSHATDGGTASREVLGLAVRIDNPSGAEPVAARLHCYLIGRCMEDPARYKVLSVQSLDLDLPPGETTSGSFRPVTNHYVSSGPEAKGAGCIGYVLQTTRRSDGRELHSVASVPVLQKHLRAILDLEIGEETDRRFVPLSAAPRAGSRQVTVK